MGMARFFTGVVALYSSVGALFAIVRIPAVLTYIAFGPGALPWNMTGGIAGAYMLWQAILGCLTWPLAVWVIARGDAGLFEVMFFPWFEPTFQG